MTGSKTLAVLVAFFATTIAANGALVYFALSTFSGEVDPSPYEHGLAYDRDIAAARAQEALGWRVSVDVKRDNAGAPAVFTIDARDAAGAPVVGLAMSASLQFASDKAFDRAFALSEFAPGRYRGETPARAGQWDLAIEARRDGQARFRSRNRIDLPR
jgi:nitrogen fixation protein FixH